MNERTNIASTIEHTLLRADATKEDIAQLCQEARTHGFHGVCVHGSRVVLAASILEDSPVRVVSVAGFPSGATDSDVKRFETETLIDLGAQEIDVVINIGRLKDGDDRYILRELRDVVEAAEVVPVKVILETCLLTNDEKRRACSLAVEAGAKFVKTSTGFSHHGATVEDVRQLKEWVGPSIGIKASGGIRDLETVRDMLNAGAIRIGTSSGVAIVSSLT